MTAIRPDHGSPHSRMRELFGIDVRTLAVFRMALATVVLYDLITRLVDFSAMYTRDGLMPPEVVGDYFADSWRWSLFWLHDASWFQATLFGAGILCAWLLLLGWQTRLATLGCWVLMTSLQGRAPLLVSGGDVLMCMLLFWSLFLPLGRHWSLDAWRRPVAGEPGTILSAASMAILLQLGFMYLFTGLAKFNPIWLEGEAIRNALSYDMIARPLGRALTGFPVLLQLITWSTLAFELAGPLLLFSPVATRWLRPLALAGFVALHVGIELTMCVVIFSYISLAGLTLFLSGRFWEWPRVHRITAWLERIAARSLAGVPRRTPATATVPVGWQRGVQVGVLLLLVQVFLQNVLLTFAPTSLARVPAPLRAVSDLLVLGQRWSMFGKPEAMDVRFVAVGQTPDGDVVDVIRGFPVDLKHPEQLSPGTPTARWMLAMRELTEDYNFMFRQSAAEYLYRHWNAAHDKPRRVDLLDFLLVEFLEPADLERWSGGTAFQPEPLLTRYGRVDALASGRYRYGHRHGPWQFHHPSGRRSAEGSYRQGRKHGLWTDWFADGRLQSRGHYVDGKMHGRWVFGYEDGSRREVDYEHDEVVGGPRPLPTSELNPTAHRD